MTIAYFVKNGLYLNITNYCSNNCIFCLRNFRDGVNNYNLKLEKEPSLEEIWEDIKSKSNEKFDEIVYCGLGEPTFRLDDIILPLSKKIKQNYDKNLRIVTNGQGNLIFPNRNIAKELADCGINKVSISLNAENKILYNKLCQPKYDDAYNSVLNFIKECYEQKNLEVEVTALNFSENDLPKEIIPDIKKCEEIANKLGVEFRVRNYIGPKLK